MKLFNHGPAQGPRLFLSALLSLFLIVGQLHNSQLVNFYSSKIQAGFIQIQEWIARPIEWYQSLEQMMSSREALLSENAQLKSQVFLLRAALQKFYALEKENVELRALLKSLPKSDEKAKVTEVISVNQMPYVQEFLVNAGKDEGAFVGQAVIAANGLAGQVINVQPHNSRVLLITDPRSAVPVEDSRTGTRGILVGTGSTQTLKLLNIPNTVLVNPGDMLVTSGLDQVFPPGFPVGVIQQISREDGADFAKIFVRPNVDVNKVRLLLLVLREKQKHA